MGQVIKHLENICVSSAGLEVVTLQKLPCELLQGGWQKDSEQFCTSFDVASLEKLTPMEWSGCGVSY